MDLTLPDFSGMGMDLMMGEEKPLEEEKVVEPVVEEVKVEEPPKVKTE